MKERQVSVSCRGAASGASTGDADVSGMDVVDQFASWAVANPAVQIATMLAAAMFLVDTFISALPQASPDDQ